MFTPHVSTSFMMMQSFSHMYYFVLSLSFWFLRSYGYSALIHFEFQDSSTPCDGSAIIPECNGLASGSVPGEDIIDLFEAEVCNYSFVKNK